jgi:large subunit ribosomal protein L28
MRQCEICGKRPVVGHRITYRGKLKTAGGVGRRTVRVNPRRFLPNLQRATLILNGTVKRLRVCTQCLTSGTLIKAPPKPSRPAPSASPHS